MVIQMNIAEAKAKLSELLDAAADGTEVIIARSGRRLARLIPIEEPEPRTLGFMHIDVPDEIFDPLSDDELVDWE